jgi:hypothetical protein
VPTPSNYPGEEHDFAVYRLLRLGATRFRVALLSALCCRLLLLAAVWYPLDEHVPRGRQQRPGPHSSPRSAWSRRLAGIPNPAPT